MTKNENASVQAPLDEENEMILMIERLNHALAESRGREDIGCNENLLRKCSQRTCMQRLGVFLPDDWTPDPKPSLAVRKRQFERRWSGLMAPTEMPKKAAHSPQRRMKPTINRLTRSEAATKHRTSARSVEQKQESLG